ncbi:MAG: type II toxin-antitoxin system HicB family antitoxin [Chloroflexi bacterium]|nr:type II toxin-antitoxin system HicB family antitoxin [Chloroflexota bacterium]
MPGCGSWGDTQERAIAHMQEAVALYIESLIARGLPIPPGITVSETPSVNVTVPTA